MPLSNGPEKNPGDIVSVSIKDAENLVKQGAAEYLDINQEIQKIIEEKKPENGSIIQKKLDKKSSARKKTDNKKTLVIDDETLGDLKATKFFNRYSFVPARLAEEIINNLPMDNLITPIVKAGGDVMFRYDEEQGIYKPDGNAWAETIIEKILEEKCKPERLSQTLKILRVKTYDFKHPFIETPNIIVFTNGVYSLNPKEFKTFSSEYISLTRVPHKYDPEIDCPSIKSFISQIAPGHEKLLQEWIGYTLLKDYRFQKALMLVGSGENGKSTLLKLIGWFLGSENVSNDSLFSLVSDRFATARLYGKLANIAPDISADELKRTGPFKALTGGDSISAQHKNKNGFSFYNHAKLFFSANKVPTTPDQSRAFFRRWCLITFNEIFTGETADKTILAKLTTPEEMSGMINWALEGLNRLIEQGDFSEPETAEDIQMKYELMSDPINAFIENCVDEITGGVEVKDEFYKAYFCFCKFKGYMTEISNIFSKLLKPRILTLGEHRPTMEDGSRYNCWGNIRLKCRDNCQGCQGCQGSLILLSGKKKIIQGVGNNTLDNLYTPDRKEE